MAGRSLTDFGSVVTAQEIGACAHGSCALHKKTVHLPSLICDEKFRHYRETRRACRKISTASKNSTGCRKMSTAWQEILTWWREILTAGEKLNSATYIE